ncbi:hypothetical protein CC78DRAFT_604897 [Lojkania enalia]|uniref:MYND-type domain-containing protein n=1 Tax=Lojkania enalia TaxID=147567 RepID=A0A9P4K6Q0_9PLEO|nr:hypothetical protein CC78DRAFT_604897 [Didymosphaeria enalia]
MSEHFRWNSPDLNSAHFHALANLLSLRNGGQAEPASLIEDVLEDDSDDDSDAASIDTDRPDQISYSGHARLKRKFLDCLAEFAANKKGGRTVACTAMKEAEDSVTLWIARNEGFAKQEEKVYDNLSGMLSHISTKNETNAMREDLWSKMLSYHQDRIERDYIPSLRASFKSLGIADSSNSRLTSTWLPNGISTLQELVFRETQLGQSTLDRFGQLVTIAYGLRTTKSVEMALNHSSDATQKTKKLWVQLCLLARLRVAFEKFSEIAIKLPSFNKVTIVLVSRDALSVRAIQQPLSLKQTFEILGHDLTPKTVQDVIGLKWGLSKAMNEFTRLQRQRLNVHAEVQMLLFLCCNDTLNDNVLPYLGCSKLGCFMCFHLLRFHGKLSMRGSHGRLFKPWTVPEISNLGYGKAKQIYGAINQLQKKVRRELLSKGDLNCLEKTSVIGGSSIASGYREEGSQRRLELERVRLKAEQDRVAERFRRLELEEAQPTKAIREAPGLSEYPYSSALSKESNYVDECSGCSRMTSRRCSVCGKDSYCSQACEDKRSGMHLFECAKRPLTSADYLCRSIVQDRIPDEDDVLEDFGFNNLNSFGDRSKLLGLYKGLYLSDEVTVEEIHQWQVDGTLVANIKEFYYRIPEAYRGGYFPWFLKHTHILERRTTKKEATDNFAAKFFDEARKYLDKEDRRISPQELEPEAKRECYLMLATVLHRAHPNPTQPGWFDFGFCTCRNEREENQLGGLYQRLLIGDKAFGDMLRFIPRHLRQQESATFTEFWRSYESGTLIELMDQKGLKSFRSDFPHLKEFLDASSSHVHPSVWSLKQFLVIDNPAEFPPVPAVQVDYGFMNCNTFEETCILMEIYKRLLQKADPLDLHSACLAGTLFEFAQGFHTMDEAHRGLMKNFYPLREIEVEEVEPTGLPIGKSWSCIIS